MRPSNTSRIDLLITLGILVLIIIMVVSNLGCNTVHEVRIPKRVLPVIDAAPESWPQHPYFLCETEGNLVEVETRLALDGFLMNHVTPYYLQTLPRNVTNPRNQRLHMMQHGVLLRHAWSVIAVASTEGIRWRMVQYNYALERGKAAIAIEWEDHPTLRNVKGLAEGSRQDLNRLRRIVCGTQGDFLTKSPSIDTPAIPVPQTKHPKGENI